MSERRGYTLLEVMVVVAIISVLAFISSVNLTLHKQRSTIRQEVIDLRGAIEKARTLSAQAGSKLGTPRITLGPSCVVPASGNTQNLWIVFDPAVARARVPVRLVTNPATDQATVVCDTFEVGVNVPGFRGAFARNVGVFAFGATGRLVADAGTPLPPDGFSAVVTHADDSHVYGFRVLPSGLVCDSTNPNPVAPGQPLCDEDF